MGLPTGAALPAAEPDAKQKAAEPDAKQKAAKMAGKQKEKIEKEDG